MTCGSIPLDQVLVDRMCSPRSSARQIPATLRRHVWYPERASLEFRGRTKQGRVYEFELGGTEFSGYGDAGAELAIAIAFSSMCEWLERYKAADLAYWKVTEAAGKLYPSF